MTLSLIFMAIAMIFSLRWFYRQKITTDKPWLEPKTVESVFEEKASFEPTAKIGLWMFLAVATSFFCLFGSAYFMRMELNDWIALPEPDLLWVNTGVLLLSSIVIQWTRVVAHSEQINKVKIGLVTGGIASLLFILGQLWAWKQLYATGYFMTANPANAFFYLLTTIHGLHLLGGLWVWMKATFKVFLGYEVASIRLSVDLCTIYWHYLLVLWLILFGLLLST